jgi:hypothetical protein
MPVAGRSLLRKPNRVSDGDRGLPRRSGLPMPVAGRSLRPSWASLARWFLRYAILAPRRKPAPAPEHGQPLARRAQRGTDRRLGERPRAAAQRRPRSPGGATVRLSGCTLAAPATAQARRGHGWPGGREEIRRPGRPATKPSPHRPRGRCGREFSTSSRAPPGPPPAGPPGGGTASSSRSRARCGGRTPPSAGRHRARRRCRA